MAHFTPVSGKLNIKIKTGENQEGKAQYRTLTLAGLNPNVTADSLDALVKAVAGLLRYPVAETVRVAADRITE